MIGHIENNGEQPPLPAPLVLLTKLCKDGWEYQGKTVMNPSSFDVAKITESTGVEFRLKPAPPTSVPMGRTTASRDLTEISDQEPRFAEEGSIVLPWSKRTPQETLWHSLGFFLPSLEPKVKAQLAEEGRSFAHRVEPFRTAFWLGEYYALGDATDSVSFATTYLRYVASFPRGQRGGLLSQEHLFRENLLKVFPMARISVIKRPNGLGQDIYGLRERAPNPISLTVVMNALCRMIDTSPATAHPAPLPIVPGSGSNVSQMKKRSLGGKGTSGSVKRQKTSRSKVNESEADSSPASDDLNHRVTFDRSPDRTDVFETIDSPETDRSTSPDSLESAIAAHSPLQEVRRPQRIVLRGEFNAPRAPVPSVFQNSTSSNPSPGHKIRLSQILKMRGETDPGGSSRSWLRTIEADDVIDMSAYDEEQATLKTAAEAHKSDKKKMKARKAGRRAEDREAEQEARDVIDGRDDDDNDGEPVEDEERPEENLEEDDEDDSGDEEDD